MQRPDCEGDEIDLVVLELAIEVQSVSEEEERADDGLHDVVRERHLSHGFQASKQRLSSSRIIEQRQQGNVS